MLFACRVAIGCVRATQPLAKDEYIDEIGNLFRHCPLQDNPKLVELVPTIDTLGQSEERCPTDPQASIVRRRAVGHRIRKGPLRELWRKRP